MSVGEDSGLLSRVTNVGERRIVYPITKLDCIDGIDEALNSKADNYFVGTMEEYEKAKSEGKIKDGMIVNITDDYKTNVFDKAVISVNGKTGEVFISADDINTYEKSVIDDMKEKIEELESRIILLEERADENGGLPKLPEGQSYAVSSDGSNLVTSDGDYLVFNE